MTFPVGKTFLLQIESASVPNTYVTLAACRTLSQAGANAAIDVTNKDGTTFRKLIEGGERTLEVTAAGVFSDDATVKQMVEYAQVGNIKNFRLTDSLGNTATGAFLVASFDKAGEYQKEITYSFKLSSAGDIVYVNT